MKKTLFALLAGAALFTACNKTDNNSLSARDRIIGKWVMTEYKNVFFINGESSSPVNKYDSLQSCERDDLYLFNGDNTLVLDEGALKCRSTDLQQRTLGTWAVTNSDTRLIMPSAEVAGRMDTLEIVELSGSTLRTRTVINGGSGLQANKTFSKR